MANINIQWTDGNQQAQAAGLTRVNAIPLDKYEIFDTFEAAEEYASSNPVSYAGQHISVVAKTYYIEGDEIPEGKQIGDIKNVTVTPYQIQGDGTLKEEGGAFKNLLNDPWEIYND